MAELAYPRRRPSSAYSGPHSRRPGGKGKRKERKKGRHLGLYVPFHFRVTNASLVRELPRKGEKRRGQTPLKIVVWQRANALLNLLHTRLNQNFNANRRAFSTREKSHQHFRVLNYTTPETILSQFWSEAGPELHRRHKWDQNSTEIAFLTFLRIRPKFNGNRIFDFAAYSNKIQRK